MKHAVLLALAAEGLLSLMDGLIKLTTGRLPVLEIAFLRFLFGSLWAIPLFAALRPQKPSREAVLINSVRAVLSAIAATAFFFALGRLPLSDAVALWFLSPVLIAVLGALLLGETINARIALALLCGFAGMLLIVGGRPTEAGYTSDAWLGAAGCLISAVAYAFVAILLRARALRDPLPTIVLFQTVGPALILAIPTVLVWTPPTAADLGLFVIIGALGTGGHYCFAHAFQRAEAAHLAPVHYGSLAWAAGFGYLLFGDVPGLATLLGAALIVLGALVTRPR